MCSVNEVGSVNEVCRCRGLVRGACGGGLCPGHRRLLPWAPYPLRLIRCASSAAPHPLRLMRCASSAAPHALRLMRCASSAAPHALRLMR